MGWSDLNGDVTITIGGQAGQGVQSIGYILAKAFVRGGLQVFAMQDYESRVRGGHNFYRVRAAEQPVLACGSQTNILVALDQLSLDLHSGELTEPGVAIFDGDKIPIDSPRPGFFPVPLERLAQEVGGNKLTANSVAAGAAAGLTGYDFDLVGQAVADQFAALTPELRLANQKVARAGYDFVLQNYSGGCACQLTPPGGANRLLMNGNEALCLGALAAGCRFVAGYPMTPSTSILEFMSTKGASLGVVAVQAEDEIAAANMVVGASFAGVRSMTATSGGGFCLMVEALGLAGMTETPVVFVNGQRPGPSTGFPTRTEQGDLEFVLHSAHGEFARIVYAPGTPQHAFHLGFRAFQQADKYQLPVIILTDSYLADSYHTVEPFDFDALRIDRGEMVLDAPSDYQRHRLTASGISPRAIPGLSEAVVSTDSDEHTEDGHITEDGELRDCMVEKRMAKKMALAASDVVAPEIFGSTTPETLLVGWGSTYGALREAVEALVVTGNSTGMLHLSQVWPFPSTAVASAMLQAKRTIVVENNSAGQLARVLRGETGMAPAGHILKYDGRPFTPEEIAAQTRRIAG
jgi:2-oxoglutarate/2-oxoacid ferredoxin oxidoreductase subunit alpha